ncbi:MULTISPECIES: type II toxin-antitoxin system RelE/ParE family toxin [Kyrpidia]|uniref:Plasmid stabilization system n=2 Tax=Kyrpidia TaxID=1129704 RepID=A0ACA8ZE19_9BACL|nr:plasmid stabilization system [Kyrpidia tusciae DSM 2912]MCL6574993.1 type II toxin-antitoxin system RelE/ParE family toxin [Kyrpidia sp.]CAB3395265.1 Plasmid stabilization system [Kyrpidia spormannii]
MTYSVSWSRQALRDLQKLDKSTATRIIAAVETFAETGRGDVRRLSNADGEYRLRVGNWRVRFILNHKSHLVVVIRVLPRSGAYKR